MDGRASLAQSLKPKLRRRALADSRAHMRSSGWFSGNETVRTARRWFNAIIGLDVPRGAGSSAAALLLLASASYGAVKGDHVADITAQVQDFCNRAAVVAGFGITEVALSGQQEVGRDAILNSAGVTDRSSLLLLDAAKMRAGLLSNPWISEATVLKLYPSRLRIEIKERVPFALWQKDGVVSLIAADGTVRKTEVIAVPHMALVHTFLLTEHWVVFPIIPIDTDIARFSRGGPMTAWVNDRPTKLALMPREGTAADVRWFEFDPRHMFHELNAWEDDGRIIADVAAANGTALFPDETGTRRTHGDTRQSLRRWTIDIATAAMREEVLNDRDIQFPRPDDRLMTRKSRQAFANINLASRDGRVEGMDAVLGFDTVTGREDTWHFGPGASAGEVVFAPRIGSSGEGDGYAMTMVHRHGMPTSELAVFAASDIAAGPLATVHIPFRVPAGFHCNFYAADSALYRQAFA